MSSEQESQTTMSPLEEHLSNIEPELKPYYLGPDEEVTVPLTLLVRYIDENDIGRYHYEAWSKEDEGKPGHMVFYADPNTSKSQVKSSWKHFKRLMREPEYRNKMIKSETLH